MDQFGLDTLQESDRFVQHVDGLFLSVNQAKQVDELDPGVLQKAVVLVKDLLPDLEGLHQKLVGFAEVCLVKEGARAFSNNDTPLLFELLCALLEQLRCLLACLRQCGLGLGRSTRWTTQGIVCAIRVQLTDHSARVSAARCSWSWSSDIRRGICRRICPVSCQRPSKRAASGSWHLGQSQSKK